MCVVEPSAVSREGDRPSPTLDRMMRLAGVGPGAAVAVCGRAGFAATLQLCRHGYARVTCVCGDGCGAQAASCGCLVVTGPCASAELEALVAGGARLLTDDGVVVAHEAGLDDDAGLARALEARGWETTWRVHDLSGPCLVAMGVRRAAAARPQATARPQAAEPFSRAA